MENEAMESLERSVKAGLTQKGWFANDPDIDSVRHCEKFKTLLQQLEEVEKKLDKEIITP
jgi:hypothetical protein